MTAVLDTNIIVYAIERAVPDKSPRSRELLTRALAGRWPVPRQVLGELLAVGHRRGTTLLDHARETVALIEDATIVIDTTAAMTLTASVLAQRYHLQYFDALICTVARTAGATVLVSEDMHDGLTMDGLTIINPFNAANRQRIDAVLDA